MERDLEKKAFMREKWKRQSRRENRSGMKLQRVKHQGWRGPERNENKRWLSEQPKGLCWLLLPASICLADSTSFLTEKNVGETVFVLQSKVEVGFLAQKRRQSCPKFEFCFVGSI